MARTFSIGGVKFSRRLLKEPRVLARVALGVLLAANMVAAVIAFKPFGGSSDDQLREQSALAGQLSSLQAQTAAAKSTVDKVEMARNEGEQFLSRYVMEGRVATSTLSEELNRFVKESGVRMLSSSNSAELVEGSDTLSMWSVTANCEGEYAQLKKFVDLVDKSKRFLIIEQMNVTSPQQQAGQKITVAMKLDVFVRDAGENQQ